MAEVSVKWDDSKLRFALKVCPVALAEEWTKGFSVCGREFNRRMVREQLTGPRPSNLGVRSGALRRSFVEPMVSGSKVENLRAVLGSTSKYAEIHERGGTVRGNPWLTIPVGPALHGSGVPRYPTARDAPGLRMILRKNGSPLLVKSVGKGLGGSHDD